MANTFFTVSSVRCSNPLFDAFGPLITLGNDFKSTSENYLAELETSPVRIL